MKPPGFTGRWLTAEADMAPFLVDWRRRWHGRARAVAQPDSTEDVAALMRWCHAQRIPVVPQGGNTGLSGGAVPDASGQAVVLSLARLRRVRVVDPVNDTLTVEAGCTLEEVRQAAQGAGRLFPLSLAAQGSCTIGGNLATNAGGVQVLRFGNARELCLGLEVVTAEGEVWSSLRGLRKDNTGYDLRDLFIGSEGTLGIITAAVLKLFPQPAVRLNALVAVPNAVAATELLALARKHFAAELTAFELFSHTCMSFVQQHVPGSPRALAGDSPWYVLLETSSAGDEDTAAAALQDLLATALDQGLASDAVLSQSLAQFDALWALRENISEAQGAQGKTIKHDISLPIPAIAGFIEDMGALLARSYPAYRLVVFGHLGDGNLHYNLSPPAGAPEDPAFLAAEPTINALVHDEVVRRGGSISAEHGLGVLRRDESARYKAAVDLKLMRAIKQALDPLGLLNPGKLLPA
jgi:FAD/FMN-containing dehydrogenase